MVDQMEETMRAIDSQYKPIVNRREELMGIISDLETQIESAQDMFDNSKDMHIPLHAAMSPEQANENKRKIVFLNRDLETKKAEYQELDR